MKNYNFGTWKCLKIVRQFVKERASVSCVRRIQIINCCFIRRATKVSENRFGAAGDENHNRYGKFSCKGSVCSRSIQRLITFSRSNNKREFLYGNSVAPPGGTLAIVKILGILLKIVNYLNKKDVTSITS